MNLITSASVLYRNSEIVNAIKRIAGDIRADYEYNRLPPVFVCVLDGAMIFCSQLMLTIDADIQIDLCTVKINSYTGALKGEHTMSKYWEIDLANRDVIIIEDIVDTGGTIQYLIEEMYNPLRGRPKSIAVAALLYRKDIEKVVEIKYKGLSLSQSDEFVIGFGLGWDHRFRNLTDIFKIKPQDEPPTHTT